MKEASGELNMTLITIVAVAAVAGLFALLWPKISDAIKNKWGQAQTNVSEICVKYDSAGNCIQKG